MTPQPEQNLQYNDDIEETIGVNNLGLPVAGADLELPADWDVGTDATELDVRVRRGNANGEPVVIVREIIAEVRGPNLSST